MNKTIPKLTIIYDGDCVLCRNCAFAFRLQQSVGEFELINAREKSPLVLQLIEQGMNLNKGMLVVYGGRYYFGQEGVRLIAMLSSRSTMFNKLLACLFKSKLLASLLYPPMTWLRGLLLKMNRVNNIDLKDKMSIASALSLYVSPNLPEILLRRYTSNVQLQGLMHIQFSRFYRLCLPVIKALKLLSPQSGRDIKAVVAIEIIDDGAAIKMDRNFYFANGEIASFSSKIYHQHNHYFLEKAGLGLTWKFSMVLDNQVLTLNHCSYGFLLGKCYVPIPGLSLLLGKTQGKEIALGQESFEMCITISHPFSKSFLSYAGVFHLEM